MVLTIKNFESQNVGPGVTETAPTNLVGVAGTLKATLTWTSATGESGVTWTEEKLVRKEGSAPQGSMDGDVVATITTKDTYATNGYEDTGLDSTKTYYYKVFAIYDNGTERGSSDVNVTPDSKPTQTFTISRTEKSNMSSGWTYSDDAAGLTAGDTAFDEFFGYSAVRLNTSGVETAEVKQTTPGQLDLTQLGDLTTGDNVMIKFPRLGIKMSKSGSNVTLSITDNPDAEADGFQYYAHSRGTLSSPIKKDALYLGAFKGYNSGSVLKSWSGQSPQERSSHKDFITLARANDGNTGSAGYDIIGFYQREFINALYMMKYGNPNSQIVIGKGYTGGSAKVNTGGTVSQILATYGTTSATQQVKLFGLEDWWGNVCEMLGGICTDGSKNLWTALSGFVGDIKTSSPYENTGAIIQNTGSGYDLSRIVGSNKGLFAPTATVSNSNYNTYYCDFAAGFASSLAIAGGHFGAGSEAGAFELNVSMNVNGSNNETGTRLMFL